MKNNNYGLVTGAAGFLGDIHCNSLINSGYGLIMVDINKSLLEKKYYYFKKNYPYSRILKYVIDITSKKKLLNLYKKLKDKFFIRVLINNACIDSKPKVKNKKISFISSWDKEFNVGLKAPYYLIEIFSEAMKNNKDGCIINIASDLSIIAPNQNIYKSSYKNFKKPITYSIIKHGLVGLTKYYASELAKYNITCNSISPVGIYNNQKKNFVKELIKLIPMKRMATKDDVKNTVDFLVNKKQKFITGQNIVIDGGRTII